MIALLEGNVVALRHDSAVVQTGGVGYKGLLECMNSASINLLRICAREEEQFK
ncbi:MAG: hypothetical protein IPK84_03315 [Candidatus Moraniibacteriota bacterium]|nr:MAG: hypothetical protein IPK84_03315 [Candidatus Moranbacteria bacterium]